jgi:hypothetical protein
MALLSTSELSTPKKKPQKMSKANLLLRHSPTGRRSNDFYFGL